MARLASGFFYCVCALFIGTQLAWGKTSSMQCLETQTIHQGSAVLPQMHHYWDELGEIQAPPLERGFELKSQANQYAFRPLRNPGKQAVLGANQSNHWLRFCLKNGTESAQNLVFALAPPVMAEIDFYPQKPGLPSFKTGNTKKMRTRDIHSPEFHFNIQLASGEQQEFYLRVFAATNAYLSAKLWDRASYEVEKDWTESAIGVFVGVLIGLILYNILLFVRVRQSTSLLYIAWSISVFLLLSSIDGRVLQYLTPNHPDIGRAVTIIFYPVSILLSALFGREFIKLKDYPSLYHLGNWILVGSLLALFVAFQFGPALYFKCCAAFALVVVVYFGLFTPIFSYLKHRSLAAKYVLITQLPLILCVVDLALFALGVTQEFYVPYTPKTGLILAMIIVSYYVGFTIYQDKDEAQRLALEQLEVSNTLKSSYNEQLQTEIKQQTADISAMNTSLEKQAAQLVELDEAKSKFFANISHEFRTPLTLIQGPLTDLIERQDFPEKDTLQSVMRNSKSLQHLIDQLLVLSELDEKSLRLHAAKTDLVELVKGYTAQFSSLAESKKVSLKIDISDSSIEAYIDAEKLQIIINNLLSNALKFSQEGDEVCVRVTNTSNKHVSGEDLSTDEYVEICVQDTGSGIAEQDLPFVFDRYFQSQSSELAKPGVGTGIGLALVKELVELHAGDVTVQSVLAGQGERPGTCFTVRLPLGRAHLTEAELALPEAMNNEDGIDMGSSLPGAELELGASTASQGDRSATILVVDDNSDMRDFIRKLLEPGYHVLTANDGFTGEQVLRQSMPDLVITDLMMPKRDGLQFVQAIKQDTQLGKIPVIMLTARASVNDRVAGLIAAVDDYLVKPFHARELTARINNLLNKQVQFEKFYAASAQQSEVDRAASGDKLSYVARVREIIDDHLADSDFGVEQLAQAMHVSSATLRRKLQTQTNFTAAAFIRHCRLEKARQLAAQGNMRTLTELANAVGFTHAGYFTRLYEKTFNAPITLQAKQTPVPESIKPESVTTIEEESGGEDKLLKLEFPYTLT